MELYECINHPVLVCRRLSSPYAVKTMYHQHGDTRYTADFGSGNSHGGVDSQAVTGRYVYGPYYGHKGPDGSPYMNPPGGGTFGSKPHSMNLPDAAYANRWSAQGYIRGAGLKGGSDYVYPNQVKLCVSYLQKRATHNSSGGSQCYILGAL